MSRVPKIVWITLLAVSGVAVLVVVASRVRPAREVLVEIGGSTGQVVEATFKVDGVVRNETLNVPATRSFDASTLQFWIVREPSAEQPELDVRMAVGDVAFGEATASSPGHGAYGGVRTASLWRIRREQSYLHPVPSDVAARHVSPPGFPQH